MKVVEKHIVPQIQNPIRLQEYASSIFKTITTRSGIKKAIKKQLILLNRKPANTGDWIKEGQLLELLAEPKHDFGKGAQSRSAAIAHKINSTYDGLISGEVSTIKSVKKQLSPPVSLLSRAANLFSRSSRIDFDSLLSGSHEAKLLNTISRYS